MAGNNEVHVLRKRNIDPWYSWEEWQLVYAALFNNGSRISKEKALDHIAAWKSRSAGKLPIAIECTASLVTAELRLDELGLRNEDETRSLPNSEEPRLLASMAVVRFINGMVDQGQKGLYARSIQVIAEEMAIPDWLVDLRHEATHSTLPSMHVLQAALRACINWLKETYWEATDACIRQQQDKSIAEIEKSLSSYVSAVTRHIVVKSPKAKAKKIPVKLESLCNALWEAVCSTNSQGFFISILVKAMVSSFTKTIAASATSNFQLFWTPLYLRVCSKIPNVEIKIVKTICRLDDANDVPLGMLQQLLSHVCDMVVTDLQTRRAECRMFCENIITVVLERPHLATGTLWGMLSSQFNDAIIGNLLSLFTSLSELNTTRDRSQCSDAKKSKVIIDAIADFERRNHNCSSVSDHMREMNRSSVPETHQQRHAVSRWDEIPIGAVLGCGTADSHQLCLCGECSSPDSICETRNQDICYPKCIVVHDNREELSYHCNEVETMDVVEGNIVLYSEIELY